MCLRVSFSFLLLLSLLLSLLPSPASSMSLLTRVTLQGGVASDASGVSPPAFDNSFFRGQDLELRMPTGAGLQQAFLLVYGGPNGLYSASGFDTPDQVRLGGRTLRQLAVPEIKELRNAEGRRLLRVYDVTSALMPLFPAQSTSVRVTYEEVGRADVSLRSSVGLMGAQLVVLYRHSISPPRQVTLAVGYDPSPSVWRLDSLASGADQVETRASLSTTVIWQESCEQQGELVFTETSAPAPDAPQSLSRTLGGRDDGILVSNPSCASKGEDTNSLITSGALGFTGDVLVGVGGDDPDLEPAGSRTDSRLSDELFRLPYDTQGLITLSYSNQTQDAEAIGYLGAALLVIDYLDADRDGVLDGVDLCPQVADPAQSDLDADGFGDFCDPCTDQDGDGSALESVAHYGTCPVDCDDLDPSLHPDADDIPYNGIDEDCARGDLTDVDFDGYRPQDGDCDDQDSTRNPGRLEACDGIDQNCDGAIDEAFDLDQDGYFSETRCTTGDDCDDEAPSVHPDAAELCDTLDNDCDGGVDSDLPGCPSADNDRDGFSPLTGDCDDTDPATAPGALEACDALDNNCAGGIDEPFDLDRDGHFDQSACPAGDDCDDSRAQSYLGADERCDGLDNDCDGFQDEGLSGTCGSSDDDLDGFTPLEGDCDDGHAEVSPVALERCDGLDNNCDQGIDEDFDLDGDGHLEQSACPAGDDCNDTAQTVFLGAPELCDGLDNDCDGSIDEDFDRDKDGYTDATTCPGLGTDCFDRNRTIYPGAPEVCNGVDNDCDGQPGPTETDLDQDGWLTCAGDCDDSRADTNPTALELCDGQDNTCEGDVDEGFDQDDDGHLDQAQCPLLGDDCEDARADISPDAPETCDGVDNDCSGASDEPFDLDQDGAFSADACLTGEDCDDSSAAVFPSALELCDGLDNNCSGQVDEALDEPCPTADNDGDGFSQSSGDCDDLAPDIHPGAVELCDGVDNNCSGQADETFDADGDGYLTLDGCPLGTDCDDTQASTYPSAEEVCDNRDNDCDGERDEGLARECSSLDLDGDGFTPRQRDCNDADPEVHPGAEELCDTVDQNCNGFAAEGFDRDLDGHQDAAACPQGTDCDDLDPFANPDAQEVCDFIDNNCDGNADEGFDQPCEELDQDGDGISPRFGDCDDFNPQVYPGAEEVCDGIDQDCTGVPDEGFDADADGYTDFFLCPLGTDCNDQDPEVYPGALERCDGIDNNCNFAVDETFDLICRIPTDVDADGDGFFRKTGDCNDFNPEIHPQADELCNGLDDDCDRLVDEGFDQDEDGDKDASQCPERYGDDCDDQTFEIHAGAKEVCDDGIDNDCDGRVDLDDGCPAPPTPTPQPPEPPQFSGAGVYCSMARRSAGAPMTPEGLGGVSMLLVLAVFRGRMRSGTRSS